MDCVSMTPMDRFLFWPSLPLIRGFKWTEIFCWPGLLSLSRAQGLGFWKLPGLAQLVGSSSRRFWSTKLRTPPTTWTTDYPHEKKQKSTQRIHFRLGGLQSQRRPPSAHQRDDGTITSNADHDQEELSSTEFKLSSSTPHTHQGQDKSSSITHRDCEAQILEPSKNDTNGDCPS